MQKKSSNVSFVSNISLRQAIINSRNMSGKYSYTCYPKYVKFVGNKHILMYIYRGADKSLARLTSRCILFDGENISFDASLVIYINSTNIPPIMIINRIYEHQNLLSLQLVSFLVGLTIYQQTVLMYSYALLEKTFNFPLQIIK